MNRAKEMGNHAARFLRSLGLSQVDVIGWSMGGFVAQALVIDEPTLVRRVVLLGTGPAASTRTPGPEGSVFEAAMTPTPGKEEFEFLFFADVPISRQRAMRSLTRINGARRGAFEPRPTPEVLARQWIAVEQWWFDPANSYFEKLTQIHQPVLILNGDRDPWFPVAGQILLYGEISDARLAIFPAAGHAAHHQYPTKIYDDALRPLGMKTSQLNILVVTARLGLARPAQISSRLKMEISTVSRNVDRMRARGWIEVIDDEKDARAHQLRLSVEGQRLLEKAKPAWEEAQQKVKDLLGEPGVEAVVSAAEKVRAMI